MVETFYGGYKLNSNELTTGRYASQSESTRLKLKDRISTWKTRAFDLKYKTKSNPTCLVLINS